MTIGPDEAAQAARDQLSGVAASVGGQDVAGVYGDPAGASQHAPAQSPEQVASGLAAAGGQAAAPDVAALLAAVQAQADQLRKLQEHIDARQAAEQIAEATPPSLLEALGSSAVGSQVAHLFAIVEARLSALEGKG